MKTRPSGLRVGVLVIGAVCAGVGAMLLFNFDPERTAFFPPCPFHYLTGIYCPGCGSTRALHHVTHGRVFAAMASNPLVPLLLPFLAFGLATQGLHWAGIRSRSGRRLPAYWIWGLLGVILVFAVLRNIRAFPFDRLAPRSPEATSDETLAFACQHGEIRYTSPPFDSGD